MAVLVFAIPVFFASDFDHGLKQASTLLVIVSLCACNLNPAAIYAAINASASKR
jgi:cation transport ATPase